MVPQNVAFSVRLPKSIHAVMPPMAARSGSRTGSLSREGLQDEL